MNFLEKSTTPVRCPWDPSHMATRETRQYKRFQRHWDFCETCKMLGCSNVNKVPADNIDSVTWGNKKR